MDDSKTILPEPVKMQRFRWRRQDSESVNRTPTLGVAVLPSPYFRLQFLYWKDMKKIIGWMLILGAFGIMFAVVAGELGILQALFCITTAMGLAAMLCLGVKLTIG